MGLIDKIREPRYVPVPQEITDRIRRGKAATREDAAKRRLCSIFLQGDQYSYINRTGQVSQLATALGSQSDKPTHRIRNRYNFIRPMVDSKVSSSTTKEPGYEVNPTGTDPAVVAASRLSEKILRMGYKNWYLGEARQRAATIAVGAGGKAYALPYFDPMVGPFIESANPLTGAVERTGEGEIKIMVFNGNEVVSEPGVEFFHSRWYAATSARPISEVQAMPEFAGGPLSSDANTSSDQSKPPSGDNVMVTMYFERPCPKYPDGRLLTIANGRQILPEGAYPMRHAGRAIDKPCLHELKYRMDPEGGGDLGLTWELIDFQRTASDCYNKLIEIKNRALMLRLIAPKGSQVARHTDEPGGVTYYQPIGGAKPEWEKAPDPAIMGQLMNLLERTLSDMRYVAADADLTAAPNVAANALQAVEQQSNNRWSTFLKDFARFDSDVAAHCLMLVQEHYTEKRVLQVRGRYGWEPAGAFYGAEILGQTDVVVAPSSIETLSRSATLQKLGWIQANFPGYLRPEVAIEIALNGTSPESVIESYENDKARANILIQNLRQNTIWDMPPTPITLQGPPDPLTGQTTSQQAMVPGWMPRPFDNTDVQLWVFENWMKSDDYARQPTEIQAAAMTIYDGYKQIQADQAAQAAAAQTAQAEQLGTTNAAKPQPQDGKTMPSTPNPAGEQPT